MKRLTLPRLSQKLSTLDLMNLSIVKIKKEKEQITLVLRLHQPKTKRKVA